MNKKMNKKLKTDIIKTTNIIREKLRALKNDKLDTEIKLEDSFRPITKPLNEFLTKVEMKPDGLKKEPTVENTLKTESETILGNTAKIEKNNYNNDEEGAAGGEDIDDNPDYFLTSDEDDFVYGTC